MSRNQRKFIALREWAATVKGQWARRSDVVRDLNADGEPVEDLPAPTFDLSDIKVGGDGG